MGRDEAFTAFVGLHRDRLLRAAYLFCGDASRAEDVTQIALCKLYVAWFRVEGSHESYVRTIIARTAVDETRRPWRREVAIADHKDVAAGVDAAVGVVARLTLRTALLTLPLRQRQVVVLRHYWGMSVHETAEVLGLSPGTVKSHGSRALKRLNTLLVLEEV